MTNPTTIEEGRLGRIYIVRLKPNQDLTEGVEAACKAEGLRHGILRSGIGSLNDASFDLGERRLRVEGPGLEILSLTGEIRFDANGNPTARLSGTVCDAEGRIKGGRFRRGENIVCITAELMIQEWVAP
jgi:predicted DNA-binding protein with PD1-like motif